MLPALLLSSVAWAQQGVAVVDKLIAEDGGNLFYARSADTGKRYRVKFADCRVDPGTLFVVVIEPAKGMGTYSASGGFCRIVEFQPQP